MWKIVNSPIVIAIIVIASLFVLKASIKPMLATEIRGVYKEITAVIEDSASDAEKSKAIQKLVQEIGAQVKEGFSVAFKTPEEKENATVVFVETKKLIKIKNIKLRPAGRQNLKIQIITCLGIHLCSYAYF